jgi:hypothetical protein
MGVHHFGRFARFTVGSSEGAIAMITHARLPLILAALLAILGPVTVAAPADAATTTVTTASGLTAAVKAAKPGTTITLKAGTYKLANLTLAANGTSSKPITLTGAGAVITTGSTSKGYGIHVTGDYWVIKAVTVTKSLKGIMADGAKHLTIDGVTVTNIGHEGIHLRANSTYAIIRNSTISKTGVVEPGYGEGIYVGSAQSLWKSVMGSSTKPDRTDHVLIEKNHITSTPAEGIDVKEGTSGGVIRGNVFSKAGYSNIHSADSWVDIKGNNYTVSGNKGSGTKLDAFQTHVQLSGWGRGTVFSSNSVAGGVPGYTVRVAAGSTGTVVKCSSLPTGKLGLSNIACTP